MRRLILLSLGVALVAAPGGVRADAELHGFVETAAGMRTAESNVIDDSDYILRESRAQIRLNAYGDASEAFIRLDVFQDAVTTDTPELELREAFLRFTTAGSHLDVKAGRQALTWGTGDLIFINDLFPKDWESFFAGREDQYLKAPSDALRLGLYGLPFDVDAVFTPEFTPDRLPAPAERFSIPATGPPPIMRPTVAENTETALRLTRAVGSFDTAFYGYRGFFKTPMGVRTDPMAVGLVPFYPELSVYGASVRGAALGGIAWVEGGYYDSRQDRDGNTPTVPNSSTRGMVGFERQLAEDFNATVQWYGEWMMKRDAALAADPATGDELRQILTLRLEKWMRYQTIRLSFFGFWSPTDEDYHLRPLVSYRFSDEVELAVGANIFEGDDPMTTFAAFDRDDNIYARLRYGF